MILVPSSRVRQNVNLSTRRPPTDVDVDVDASSRARFSGNAKAYTWSLKASNSLAARSSDPKLPRTIDRVSRSRTTNAAARADGGAGADGGIAVRLIVSKERAKAFFTAIFDARARERAREGRERTNKRTDARNVPRAFERNLCDGAGRRARSVVSVGEDGV
jgi:hypothetical protein